VGEDFQHSVLDEWKLQTARMRFDDPPVERPTVLLCGAKAWPGSAQPDHTRHFPAATWVTTDLFGGDGVQIVGDLHSLHLVTGQRFDGVFCPAVLEHVERPWVAMYSMGQLLRPGGLLFVQTHQTFPLHGYPSDHFRFSTAAMRTMAHDAGLETLACDYDGPCTITPLGDAVWNELGKAYLNVCICARRPA
jgi:SAM-dependent methyltransferase